MRLSGDQVKQGIFHPNQLVRSIALRHFSKPLSQDPTTMSLAIQAFDMHGWDQAFELVWEIGELVQTEDTLLWLSPILPRVHSLGHLDGLLDFVE